MKSTRISSILVDFFAKNGWQPKDGLLASAFNIFYEKNQIFIVGNCCFLPVLALQPTCSPVRRTLKFPT